MQTKSSILVIKVQSFFFRDLMFLEDILPWNFKTFGLLQYLLWNKTNGRQSHRKGQGQNIMTIKMVASPNFKNKIILLVIYLWVGRYLALQKIYITHICSVNFFSAMIYFIFFNLVLMETFSFLNVIKYTYRNLLRARQFVLSNLLQKKCNCILTW